MRIAVLADIHANLAAFEAVLADLGAVAPDTVFVAGDCINRGPQPQACLDQVLERRAHAGWKVIKGNHEDYVLTALHGTPHAAPWERQLFAHTRWTAEQIGSYEATLRAMPDQLELPGPDGHMVRMVHASMRGNRVGLYADMDDATLRAHAEPLPAVLAVGHTHVPFVRRIGDTLIVNAGAVGMPFDRDPRASYALLDWSDGTWQATIRRVPYDRAATITAFDTSGYFFGGAPMTRLILDELLSAAPRLGLWHRWFEKEVAEGGRSVDETIDELLRRTGGRPPD